MLTLSFLKHELGSRGYLRCFYKQLPEVVKTEAIVVESSITFENTDFYYFFSLCLHGEHRDAGSP